MTKVIVHSGICGFTVSIFAEKSRDKKVRISVETECENVKSMLQDVPAIDMMAVFTGYMNNPVYRSAATRLKHVACPVPSAILKAVEVEAGFCLPKDVSITFIK